MLVLTRRIDESILIGPIGSPTLKIVPTVTTRFRACIEVNEKPIEIAIGETLAVSPGIGICLLGIRGRNVRLGIDAPRSTQIHRSEVAERIQAEAAAVPA